MLTPNLAGIEYCNPCWPTDGVWYFFHFIFTGVRGNPFHPWCQFCVQVKFRSALQSEGGSHYWEMAVAITCGYGGYLLPLLAAHSSIRLGTSNRDITVLQNLDAFSSWWLMVIRCHLLGSFGTVGLSIGLQNVILHRHNDLCIKYIWIIFPDWQYSETCL